MKGTPNVSPTPAEEGQKEAAACDAIATRIVTPQASAPDSTESHETTEPAATIQVAAGSSEITPVTKTGTRQEAAQKSGRPGHGWQGGRNRGRRPGENQAALAMDGRAAVKWRG